MLCAIVDLGAVETEMCHEILALNVTNHGSCQLHCAGLAGTNYTIQASDNLVTWTNLASLQAGMNSLFEYTDWLATNHERCFYRLLWP